MEMNTGGVLVVYQILSAVFGVPRECYPNLVEGLLRYLQREMRRWCDRLRRSVRIENSVPGSPFDNLPST